MVDPLRVRSTVRFDTRCFYKPEILKYTKFDYNILLDMVVKNGGDVKAYQIGWRPSKTVDGLIDIAVGVKYVDNTWWGTVKTISVLETLEVVQQWDRDLKEYAVWLNPKNKEDVEDIVHFTYRYSPKYASRMILKKPSMGERLLTKKETFIEITNEYEYI